MVTGWHIGVFRQTHDGTSPAQSESAEGQRVAVWQTGADGLDWLDNLATNGLAADLGGNGYPRCFTVQAKYVTSEITNGPPGARKYWYHDPDDIIGPEWAGETVIDQQALSDCRADEWLKVVAWDES